MPAHASGCNPATRAVFYETTQVPADPLAPDATPLDVAETVDEALWIAVLRTEATDLRALGGRSIFIGFAFDERIERPFALQDLGADEDDDSASAFDAGELTADPPSMLWRLWQGPGRGFATLDVGDDSTRGLVTTGVVEVELPPQLPVLDPVAATPGDLESPPPLTDEEQTASVVAWLQVRRPRTEHLTDPVRKIRWVGLNAVLAEHARTASPEQLGSGTGDTDQRYALTKHPVLPGSTRLQVAEPDGWRDWVEVDTYLVSGPEDRHYTVDHDSGAVVFDGRRLPQLGEQIRVTSYRYGGGAAGNVAAASITRFQGVGGVEVTNPLPAVGGADAAGLDEAMDEIPAEVHRRDRCVTAEDFCEMARRVSGVGRAETLTLLHPDTPSVQAAGVVSVVVLPVRDLSSPRGTAPRLRPAPPGCRLPRRPPVGHDRALRHPAHVRADGALDRARGTDRIPGRCRAAAGSSRSCGSTSRPFRPQGLTAPAGPWAGPYGLPSSRRWLCRSRASSTSSGPRWPGWSATRQSRCLRSPLNAGSFPS